MLRFLTWSLLSLNIQSANGHFLKSVRIISRNLSFCPDGVQLQQCTYGDFGSLFVNTCIPCNKCGYCFDNSVDLVSYYYFFFLNFRFVALEQISRANQSRYIGKTLLENRASVWTVPLVPLDHSLLSHVEPQLKIGQPCTAFLVNLAKHILTSSTKVSVRRALYALQGKQ